MFFLVLSFVLLSYLLNMIQIQPWDFGDSKQFSKLFSIKVLVYYCVIFFQKKLKTIAQCLTDLCVGLALRLSIIVSSFTSFMLFFQYFQNYWVLTKPITVNYEWNGSKTINLKIDEAPTRPYTGHDLLRGDVMQISKDCGWNNELCILLSLFVQLLASH